MHSSVVEWAAGVTAILAALAAVFQAIRWTMSHMLRLSQFLNTWQGTPARDGMPEVPSIPAQLQHIQDLLHEQGHQLNAHGAQLIMVQTTLEDHGNRISDLEGRRRRVGVPR